MKSLPIFGLLGAGGFAREVMPLISGSSWSSVSPKLPKDAEFRFVLRHGSLDLVNGVPVLLEDDFLSASLDRYFNVAIADSQLREKLTLRCIESGALCLSIISIHALVYDTAILESGAIVCPGAIVTANVSIGLCFHLNFGSYVAHDCKIGNYVTFAPHVMCNGYVHIEDHVYIGTGAIIKPGSEQSPRRIGRGAVIGMGAVVTRDVEPGATVIGNPARAFVNDGKATRPDGPASINQS